MRQPCRPNRVHRLSGNITAITFTVIKTNNFKSKYKNVYVYLLPVGIVASSLDFLVVITRGTHTCIVSVSFISSLNENKIHESYCSGYNNIHASFSGVYNYY